MTRWRGVLVTASALLTVALAVAVNVGTGGTLPGPLRGHEGWAWPAVGVTVLALVVLGVVEQRAGRSGAPDTTAAWPDDRPTTAIPRELPAPMIGFTGRGRDITTVLRLVVAGPVAVVGGPGAGKSALALHVAHELAPGFCDGSLYARLAGATAPVPPATVLTHFLQALGLSGADLEGDVDTLAARYRSALAGRQLVVVLDDAAGLWQVAPLLPGRGRCAVLVTSRQPLADVAALTVLRLDALSHEDALRVFRSAAPALPSPLSETERMALAIVLDACAGLPLALRIAGARLRLRPTWSIVDLAARLAPPHRRLDELQLHDSAVRTAFDTSYQELSDTDRDAFRWLGAAPGREVTAHVVAVLAGSPVDAVEGSLERLVDAFLVETPAPQRYRQHDLLHLFALERLGAEVDEGDRIAAGVRLHAWVEGELSDDLPGWTRADRESLAAIVEAALAAGDTDAVLRLAGPVVRALNRSEEHPIRLSVAGAALAAAGSGGDAATEGWAHREAARALDVGGRYAEAVGHAQAAIRLAVLDHDRDAEAEGLVLLGTLLRNLGRHDEAQTELSRALDLARSCAAPDHELSALVNLGLLHLSRWQAAEAVTHLETALPLLDRAREGERLRGWALSYLGAAHNVQHNATAAVPLLEASVRVFREQRDRIGEGYALRELAYADLQRRAWSQARATSRDALVIFESVGHRTGIAYARQTLGEIDLEAGEPGAALEHLTAAAGLFADLYDPVHTGLLLLQRARATALLGRREEAMTQRAVAEERLAGASIPEVEEARRRLDEYLAASEAQPPG